MFSSSSRVSCASFGALQITLRHRDHVQKIAVLREPRGQRFGERERPREIALLDVFADALGLRVDIRGAGFESCVHPWLKEAGIAARLFDSTTVGRAPRLNGYFLSENL